MKRSKGGGGGGRIFSLVVVRHRKQIQRRLKVRECLPARALAAVRLDVPTCRYVWQSWRAWKKAETASLRRPISYRSNATMLAPSLAILRRSAANSSRIVGAARHLTGGASNISVDHYSSGWKIDDIADFTKEGKFHIKTYNKISEQVRMPFHSGCTLMHRET